MPSFLNSKNSEQEESHWLSVSDLMAGLMMVFLFIAVALMRQAFVERDKIKEIAVAYQENQVAIYDALMYEFEQNLLGWNANIDKNSLTFTFQSPDVLFAQGDTTLNNEYKTLLNDFFPRYLNVLEPFFDSVNEVRIEGHTSSVWNQSTTPTEAYFRNMKLSQARTLSVLQYVYVLAEKANKQDWVKRRLAAVGLSSSRIIEVNGKEDQDRSRRVTFRVITNADIQMKQILDTQ